MRKPIIAGNWKMNKTNSEAIALAGDLKRHLSDCVGVDIVICPPFTALSEVAAVVDGSGIDLGAQNIYFVKEGAYTGEISPLMLKDIGCQFVIIGHSERRALFGETNEGVNQKLITALEYRFSPIVCVGETLQERQADQAFKIIEEQVRGALNGISPENMLKVIIAYEPVWAIGTGQTAGPDQAQEVHAFIRELLKDLYGTEVSDAVRIQYGGSVKPDNIKELINQPDINGALVGGASLKTDLFVQIVTNCVIEE